MATSLPPAAHFNFSVLDSVFLALTTTPHE